MSYNETLNKENKNSFSAHTITSQSLLLDDDFNNNDNSEKEKGEIIEVNTKDKCSEKESKKEKDSKVLILNSNKKKKVCRICYLEEDNKRLNPLIKPCKCSGSMKYIHYECLLHWLKTKLIIDKKPFVDNDYYDIYRLDLLECELCKNHLLNYIRHNNKIYSLIDYQRLDAQIEKLLSKNGKTPSRKENNNYIIFDDILPGKNGFLCRYLVKFNEDNTLKIGRALDNQLILNDISVSRNHCLIRIDQGYNLILEDCNSKFGSLVLIQAEEIEILKGKTLTIQSGTNYFSFKLELPSKLFSCCSAEEIDDKRDYERLNSKWVKFDKNPEILNESISGVESSDEKNENKNENNKNMNKDKTNDIHDIKENQKDLNEKDKEKEKEEEETNIIVINEIKNENNNTKNTNNIDSGNNISTLKINNAVNISQIENAMDEIREENKSEIENNCDNRSQNNINNENNKLINPGNCAKDNKVSDNNSEKN